VALVNTARQLGFNFLGRNSNNIFLDLQGEKVQFEVLNVLEFSSDRRRMSVIARSPDGTIRLFIKVPSPFSHETLLDRFFTHEYVNLAAHTLRRSDH
jgi:magnesium-transporting ATPase (P-type)